MSIADAARRGADRFLASEEYALMLRRAVKEAVEEEIKWRVWRSIQPSKASSPTP